MLCALNAPLAKAQTNADSCALKCRLGGSQGLRSHRASCTQTGSSKKYMRVMVRGHKSKKGAEESPVENFCDPIQVD